MAFIYSPYSRDIYPIGPQSQKSLHDAYDRITSYKKSALQLDFLRERFAFYDKRDPVKIDVALDKFGKLIRKVWLPVNYSPFCKYIHMTQTSSKEDSTRKKTTFRLVKSEEEFERAKETYYDEHELKLQYLYKKFFTDDQIIEYLFKFMDKYPFVGWNNIVEHEDSLRDYIGTTVEKMIRLIINNESI